MENKEYNKLLNAIKEVLTFTKKKECPDLLASELIILQGQIAKICCMIKNEKIENDIKKYL